MQAVAAGSAKGNKHISHRLGAPVTVQMASPGREAGRAIKKDEQSDREGNTEEERQREGRNGVFSFFMGRFLKETGEKGGVGGQVGSTCLCNTTATGE